MDVILAQNTDIIHNILRFLDNDGNSVVRFALSSKDLYDRIMRQEIVDPSLWKNLVCNRYKRSRCRPPFGMTLLDEDEFSEEDTRPTTITYRDLYVEKRRADFFAMIELRALSETLEDMLQVNETQQTIADGNPHVGQAWEPQQWHFLLRNREHCYDVFKSTARRHIGSNPSSSARDRLKGFLAARCVQDFYFADCMFTWKCLEVDIRLDRRVLDHQALQLNTARHLEEYVLLVCDIQKTPFDILLDDSCHSDVSVDISPAKKSLDDISGVCKDRIEEELGASASVTSKLKIVNDVLVNRCGFSGNVEDYYNYRNVLMDHVLESKTGMPLTLCIIYCCTCRRLGIAVQVTGLPGHIVVGFDTNDASNSTTESRSFIDVFHNCRFLSREDCRQLVGSYRIGWNEDFLEPLSTKMTIQRIFNNLRNCHEKALSHQQHPPPFCTDLLFQQHTVGMIHRYESTIACTLLDRLSDDLSIVLSPDLLRAYNLLPLRGLGRDPVINATHARALLELSSYAGLSYHNYA